MGWEEWSRKQVGTGPRECGMVGAAVTAAWLGNQTACGQVLQAGVHIGSVYQRSRMVVTVSVGTLQQQWEAQKSHGDGNLVCFLEKPFTFKPLAYCGIQV